MSPWRAAGAARKWLRYFCLQFDWTRGQRISRKGLVLRRMEFTVWDESRSRALKFFPYGFRGGTPRPKFGSFGRGEVPVLRGGEITVKLISHIFQSEGLKHFEKKFSTACGRPRISRLSSAWYRVRAPTLAHKVITKLVLIKN